MRFHSALQSPGSLFEFVERSIEICTDGIAILIPSLEEKHGRKGHSGCVGRVLKAILIVPKRVADDSFHAIAPRSTASGTSNGHTDLEGDFQRIRRHEPVQDADASAQNRTAFRILSVKQRLDETPAFQTT